MPTPKDPREHLQRRAEAAVKKGVRTLEDAIDTTKWQACGKCGSKVYFKDVRAITEALKFFMDYGYGKPETRKPQKEEVKIESKRLEDLSMEELLALAEEE